MASANGHVDVAQLLLDADAVSSGPCWPCHPADTSISPVICVLYDRIAL